MLKLSAAKRSSLSCECYTRHIMCAKSMARVFTDGIEDILAVS